MDSTESTLVRAVSDGRESDVVHYLSSADRSSPTWQPQLDYCLVTAVEQKHPKVMELLIEAGADMDQIVSLMPPKTLLMLAFESEDHLVVDTFMGHFKGYAGHQLKTCGGGSVMYSAIHTRKLEFVERACTIYKDNGLWSLEHYGVSPIHIVAKLMYNAQDCTDSNNNESHRNTMEIIEYLLQQGCNTNYRTNYRKGKNWSPLHYVSAAGCVEAARLMVKYGADLSLQDEAGAFPWVAAGQHKHYSLMEELIDAADLNKVPAGKREPLSTLYIHQACKSGLLAAVKYLQGKGVGVNCVRSNGLTPLMTAAGAGQLNVVQYFLDENLCDVNFMSQDQTALSVVLDDIRHADTNAKHQAQSVHTAEVLLKAGANVNAQDSRGYPLLMQIRMYRDRCVRGFLLDHGADINAVAVNGRSVLWVASYHDAHIENRTIPELLAQNIDMGVSRHQHQGVTPLQVAYRQGKHELCELLLDAGCCLHHISDDLDKYGDWQNDVNIKTIRNRIQAMNGVPRELQEQCRHVILRAMGQGDLARKLSQLHRTGVLPRPVMSYLGKTINFVIAD